MARPRISAEKVSLHIDAGKRHGLTVNVTLSLICLRDEEIGNMSTDVVLIAGRITSKYFLKT